MSRSPILALFAFAALALVGCGGAASRTTSNTTAARRGGEHRDSSLPTEPPPSSLPYEQHLLSFHAAPLSGAQREQLVSSGETEIPVHVKKRGSLSAFGQAQIGFSIVRVANAPSVSAKAGTVNLDLRLTARASRLLAKGDSMLIYMAIKFSGSRIRQQLTVPLHG